MGTKYEQSVANVLPDVETLKRAYEQLSEIRRHTQDRGEPNIELSMTGIELDSVANEIANILRAPIGADLLLIILPVLIKTCTPE